MFQVKFTPLLNVFLSIMIVLFSTMVEARPHKHNVIKHVKHPHVVKHKHTKRKVTPKKHHVRMVQNGVSSYYGRGFNGRKTASGTIFHKSAMTAAHRSLPFGTKVRVTDKDTGKSVIVKITDRGPFHANRILDLSEGAAKRLGITKKGTCDIKLQVISVGDGKYKSTIPTKHSRRSNDQRDLIAELIKTRHLSNS